MGGPTGSYTTAGIVLEFIGGHKPPHTATECFRQGGDTIEGEEITGNILFARGLCEERVDPCLSQPCTTGSTCDALQQEGFICKCPPGRKGKLCQDLDAEVHEIFIPEFNGNSYLELPRLEGVGHAFSLEVWFLSREPDGVLLYNDQPNNGKGDFISIHLIRRHVQFQFDLGSGAANLT